MKFTIIFLLLLIQKDTAHGFGPISDVEMLASGIQQRVLLITIDGFRSEYIKTYKLPNFQRFIKHGVYSQFMLSEFPSLTIPSFWSMATGVHTDKHGLVSNNFYDPILNRKFDHADYSYTRLKLWSNYDPIWVDAVKSGLKTGLLFWPTPNQMLYNPLAQKKVHTHTKKSLSLNEKIDVAIDLFRNGEFQFCVVRHNEPGMVSFEEGIGGERFNRTMRKLDESLGYLLMKMEHNFMIDASLDFNVMIVSNYGRFGKNSF